MQLTFMKKLIQGKSDMFIPRAVEQGVQHVYNS